MKCSKLRLFATLSLFLVLCLQISAQSVLFQRSYDKKKKVSATLTALFSKVPPSGYLPVRLELNNATEQSKSWSIDCTANTFSNVYYNGKENSKIESSFSYTCPPKSSKTFDFYVPVSTTIANASSSEVTSNVNFAISSSGKKDQGYLSSTQRTDFHAIAISNALYTEHASKLDSLAASKSGSYSSYSSVSGAYASSFNPEMLAADWKGYVGYDSLVCIDSEWLSMDKAVQSAILEWNRLGGKLIILKLNSASNFKSLDIDKSATGTLLDRSYGKVELITITKINASDIPNLIEYAVDKRSANLARSLSILNDYEDGTWELMKSMGLAFNPIYLILILIVFGIVVGPVNLFYFAKSGQRHRLFITTPIIAITASLILILIIVIQDGFGGYGSRVQLVEVRPDNGENKAYVMQEQIVRTGVILSNSFETSAPAYITPVPLEESRFSRVTKSNEGGSGNYVANHGKTGLRASGDWFQSRSLHAHYLESVVSTRARITLKSAANSSSSPQLNSSFSYPISAVLYRDTAGDYWISSALAPGDTVTLKSTTAKAALEFIEKANAPMAKRMKSQLNSLWTRKGHFVAITEQAPAIDTLDSILWNHTYSVLTGPVVQ